MSFKTGKNFLEGFGHLTSSPASPEDGKEPNIGKETSHQSVLAVDHDKGIVAIDTLQEAEQFGDNEDISNKASLIVLSEHGNNWKPRHHITSLSLSSYYFTFIGTGMERPPRHHVVKKNQRIYPNLSQLTWF